MAFTKTCLLSSDTPTKKPPTTTAEQFYGTHLTIGTTFGLPAGPQSAFGAPTAASCLPGPSAIWWSHSTQGGDKTWNLEDKGGKGKTQELGFSSHFATEAESAKRGGYWNEFSKRYLPF